MASTLERRELGNTGLKVSCIGFGASPLGNVFGHVSPGDALAAVREALRLGINFFDTSPYYGGTVSETVLGNCLKELGVRRDEIVVSTKCGRYMDGFDFSAERVTRSIDESLARLKMDYVDILHCHDIEFGSLDQIVNETIPALQKLKEAGKIRFIGITGLPLGIFTYVLDRVPPGSVDVILSYCHYSINDSTLVDLLPYLKSKGVGVISASPLAMGLLTENGPPEWHPASPELKSACRAAAAHCKERGKNILKVALQYSLTNKEISTVLVGMNSPRQSLVWSRLKSGWTGRNLSQSLSNLLSIYIASLNHQIHLCLASAMPAIIVEEQKQYITRRAKDDNKWLLKILIQDILSA